MTRDIRHISEAIEALKSARTKLFMVSGQHTDDGQNDIIDNARERIRVSMEALTEIENELRHGKVLTQS